MSPHEAEGILYGFWDSNQCSYNPAAPLEPCTLCVKAELPCGPKGAARSRLGIRKCEECRMAKIAVHLNIFLPFNSSVISSTKKNVACGVEKKVNHAAPKSKLLTERMPSTEKNLEY